MIMMNMKYEPVGTFGDYVIFGLNRKLKRKCGYPMATNLFILILIPLLRA